MQENRYAVEIVGGKDEYDILNGAQGRTPFPTVIHGSSVQIIKNNSRSITWIHLPPINMKEKGVVESGALAITYERLDDSF